MNTTSPTPRVLKNSKVKLAQAPKKIAVGESPKNSPVFQPFLRETSIELVEVEGVVRFIKVQCGCGQNLTIKCEYS